jgi:hypothetical protein
MHAMTRRGSTGIPRSIHPLKARLEARQFIVQSAEDGEEALAQFKDFSPGVALEPLIELGTQPDHPPMI